MTEADLHDEVERRPLDDLIPYANNPKEHPDEQVKKIASSIKNYGWDQPIVVDGEGEIIKGHGRLQAAKMLGLDEIPVIWREDLSDAEAKAARIADNKTAESVWNDDLLTTELELLEDFDPESLGFEPYEIDDIIDGDGDVDETEPFQPHEIDPENMSSRDSPVDAIITLVSPPACCAAVDAGFMIGFQSGSEPNCRNIGHTEGHDIAFIDNEWGDYDHETHLRQVKEWEPKYATTRDIVSREDCREEGIEYYSPEQILEWADELDQYAENVIVIPKFDCIDGIPDRYVLGYSVPTSHGGTTVDVERFRGHDIHLLGGSWKKQLQFIEEFGEDVVSLDNNYINKITPFGNVRLKNGEQKELNTWGFDELTNPRMSAMTLSFGNMMSNLQDLYTEAPNE